MFSTENKKGVKTYYKISEKTSVKVYLKDADAIKNGGQ
jgi:hypothetical protein